MPTTAACLRFGGDHLPGPGEVAQPAGLLVILRLGAAVRIYADIIRLAAGVPGRVTTLDLLRRAVDQCSPVRGDPAAPVTARFK